MLYYIDSNGKQYIGKIHICAQCKREKVVRKNKTHNLCRKCSYGKRKTDIKDDKLFVIIKSNNRIYRSPAIQVECEICHRQYLRRIKEKYKTNICNLCICNFNGKKSYKTGIGNYVKRALEKYGNFCSICKNLENIEVHHVDFDRSNNIIENLQVLCKSCHKKIHWKIKKDIK